MGTNANTATAHATNPITGLMNEFAAACEPLESGDKLLGLKDARTVLASP